MRVVGVGLIITVLSTSAMAGQAADPGQYAGPRIGATFLAAPVRDELRRDGLRGPALILQFGWQWEQRFEIDSAAPLPMTQFVLLVGGAEQGLFLPSLSWLIGVRGRDGGEIGIGPNLSLSGVSIAIAAGFTKRVGALNVPWNVAVVPGSPGLRVSLLTGFNMISRRPARD